MFFDSRNGYKYSNKCCMKGAPIMVNKLDFNAKNLTSNAGTYLLLEEAKNNGIFDLIENDPIFDNESADRIIMNHIKTML